MTTENKQTDNRTRERILDAAAELFPQYGIKGVSMDELARQLTMSKRTLYEYFSDKEELLVGCIEYNEQRMKEWAEEINARAETVLHVILELYCEMVPKMRHYSNKFNEDLRKYPRALAAIAKHRKEHVQDMMKFFETGLQQGIFLPGINYHILIYVMMRSMDVPLTPEMTRRYTVSEIRSNLLLTLLRGTCTEKGLKIFDDYIVHFHQKTEPEL